MNVIVIIRKAMYLLLAFSFASFSNVFAQLQQIRNCDPNIDFEFGDLTLWQCFTGTVNSQPNSCSTGTITINYNNPIPPIATRHGITNVGQPVDPHGLFPVVAPWPGNTHSLRLGDQVTGAQAEAIRYKVKIPLGANNFSFTFMFATILENPAGHGDADQAHFEIKAIDSATLQPLDACSQLCFNPNQATSQPNSGFYNSAIAGSSVQCRSWDTGYFRVKGTAGQTVYIEFANADCSLSGHWGYSYIDIVQCGFFNTALAICDLDGTGVTLNGPPGYVNYQWYDPNWNQVATGQTAVFQPTSTTPERYYVVLTPDPNLSTCLDTIQTNLIANVAVAATPDTLCITPGVPIQMNANASGGTGPLTYQWSEIGTGGVQTLSCYTCANPVATPVGTSFYTVRVSDTNNCYRTDTLQALFSVFRVDAGPDFTTCVGTSRQINASVNLQSSAFSYKWDPATDLNHDTLLQPTYNPTVPGEIQYVLTVDSIACAKTDTVIITTLPNDFNIQDTTICSGAVVQVAANGDQNFTYSWTPSIGLSNPNIINPMITTDTSRSYVVTARYPGCPDIVKTYKIEVEPQPTVDLGPDKAKCEFESLFIASSVSPGWYPNYSYQWEANPGISGSLTTPSVNFTGSQDTSLILRVTTPVGCTDDDTVRVIVHPGNFATVSPIDTSICPNNTVSININGGSEYVWEPSTYLDDSTSGNVVSSPVSGITYTVYVKDTFGCSDTVTASIQVYADALLDLGADVTIYPGDTIQMTPQGNVLYYQWSPSVGLSATNIANPKAYPSVNTRYYVTGYTEHGCEIQDSIDVNVSTESLLEMPNAFTPGVGDNSTFKVVRRGIAKLNSFIIYNRWGTKVFETNNIDEGWDGRYQGTPQPMGVYIYTIDAVSVEGRRRLTQKGNVTLIR